MFFVVVVVVSLLNNDMNSWHWEDDYTPQRSMCTSKQSCSFEQACLCLKVHIKAGAHVPIFICRCICTKTLLLLLIEMVAASPPPPTHTHTPLIIHHIVTYIGILMVNLWLKWKINGVFLMMNVLKAVWLWDFLLRNFNIGCGVVVVLDTV